MSTTKPSLETNRRLARLCATRALVEYETIVRINDSEEWPAITNVAFCRDGMWGAEGEIIDVAFGLYPEIYEDAAQQGGFHRGDAVAEAVRAIFPAFQYRLQMEVAAR